MVLHSCDDGCDAVGSVIMKNVLSGLLNDQYHSILPMKNKSGQGGAITFPLRSQSIHWSEGKRNEKIFSSDYYLDGIRDHIKSTTHTYRYAVLGINSGFNFRRDIIHSANISAAIWLSLNGIPAFVISVKPQLLCAENILHKAEVLISELIRSHESNLVIDKKSVYAFNIVNWEGQFREENESTNSFFRIDDYWNSRD